MDMGLWNWTVSRWNLTTPHPVGIAWDSTRELQSLCPLCCYSPSIITSCMDVFRIYQVNFWAARWALMHRFCCYWTKCHLTKNNFGTTVRGVLAKLGYWNIGNFSLDIACLKLGYSGYSDNTSQIWDSGILIWFLPIVMYGLYMHWPPSTFASKRDVHCIFLIKYCSLGTYEPHKIWDVGI